MNPDPMATERTLIYQRTEDGEEHLLGFIDGEGRICRLRWGEGIPIGRVTADGCILRKTTYGERELGTFTPAGVVRSHGLFQGGELGWVDPDGVVNRGGLILGEEEVGRVEGPMQAAGAAALLLLFLPEEADRGA